MTGTAAAFNAGSDRNSGRGGGGHALRAVPALRLALLHRIAAHQDHARLTQRDLPRLRPRGSRPHDGALHRLANAAAVVAARIVSDRAARVAAGGAPGA